MENLPDPAKLTFGAVILAAGASTRMGRPKMLLPWGGTSILGHLIGVWNKIGAAQVGVVLSPASPVAGELDRLHFPDENRIPNPDPVRGMFSSIHSAASWAGWSRSLTHWVLVLGDQPHLHPATLQALIEFAENHPDKICLPSRGGHRRHPVILPAAVFGEIAGATENTLREYLGIRTPATALIEIDDPGLDLDIDRPEDYEEAKTWLAIL
jgi:molybdenum cofactor cytidylyltransferase